MKGGLLDLRMVPFGRQQQQMGDDKSESGNDNEAPDIKPTVVVDKNRGRFIAEPVAEPLTAAKPGAAGGGGRVLIRYRECMRNHAASIGGHANDGCGEFMQGIEGLRCAACGCHRNFHRKELQSSGSGGGGDHHHRHRQPPAPQPAQVYNSNPRWQAEKKKTGGGFPSLSSLSLPQFTNGHGGGGIYGAVDLGQNNNNYNQMSEDRRSETPEEIRSGGGGGVVKSSNSSKRFRTKFSQEQKEKMLEFAEKLGWRIQKHDDVAISQFCLEVGVKRHVLKVWMHNNKNTYKKRENINAPPPPPPQGQQPPPPPGMQTESPPSADSPPRPSINGV